MPHWWQNLKWVNKVQCRAKEGARGDYYIRQICIYKNMDVVGLTNHHTIRIWGLKTLPIIVRKHYWHM